MHCRTTTIVPLGVTSYFCSNVLLSLDLGVTLMAMSDGEEIFELGDKNPCNREFIRDADGRVHYESAKAYSAFKKFCQLENRGVYEPWLKHVTNRDR